MIRALLLDAAGTLIDLAEPVGKTYARILGQHGIHLPAAELESRFRRTFGSLGEPDFAAHPDGDTAERAWWRNLVETALCHSVTDAAFTALFDHYARPDAWTVFPEVPDVLHAARDAGFTLAVVSNFDLRLHPILEGLGLAPFFDLIVSSADARARKPSPSIFRHALDRLGVSPAESLHAGDSPVFDIEAATACGIGAYHVDRPARCLRGLLEQAAGPGRK